MSIVQATGEALKREHRALQIRIANPDPVRIQEPHWIRIRIHSTVSYSFYNIVLLIVRMWIVRKIIKISWSTGTRRAFYLNHFVFGFRVPTEQTQRK